MQQSPTAAETKPTAGHTPGPWAVSHRLNSIGQPGLGGRYVILWEGHSKREDFFIAEMPFASARDGDVRQHEANARLIAAAPDLHAEGKNAAEALAEAAIHLEAAGLDLHAQECRRHAANLWTAIAKAEGR